MMNEEEKISSEHSYSKFRSNIDRLMKAKSLNNELIILTEHTNARIIDCDVLNKGMVYKYLIILNDHEHLYNETCVFLYDSMILFNQYDLNGIINGIINRNTSYQIWFNKLKTFDEILTLLREKRDEYGMLVLRALIEISEEADKASEVYSREQKFTTRNMT